MFELMSPSQKSCLTGKGKNFAGLSAKTNTQEKTVSVNFWKIVYQNHSIGAKKDSLKYKHGLMLFGKKSSKTARDINKDVPEIALVILWCFFVSEIA
jgi:hypothetical protein